MDKYAYKENIVETRKIGLGSSDAHLLAQIDSLGTIPKHAYKRFAIIKGLVEYVETPTTQAMKLGDYIENLIFEYLDVSSKNYQSNPLWISEKYSRKNCKLFSHPDIVLKDDESKELRVYEVKSTKDSFNETRKKYKAQLYIHWLLANEYASKYVGYKVKLFLVHYSTKDLNLEDDFSFDAQRLTVKGIRFNNKLFDVSRAMDIVDDFLEGFKEYYEDDAIDYDYLPQKIKGEFDVITNMLIEIKERENKIESFKDKLYAFMEEKNIKSIKNENWSITRTLPTESVQFDSKRYLEDYANKYPRKYAKLLKTYEKRITRKGSVQFRIKQ